ncbi:hemerythrin domain-containing protein [Streptosporangium sp. NPDC000396]|uniref:hemerythrin domain-containing protein n=1 Tax=Streptosporangium sp. NPDC000396 TaxID=3366185 RepID=UPI0036C7BE34
MKQITPRREGDPPVDLTVGLVEHRAIRADLLRLVNLLGDPTAGEMPGRRAQAVRTYIDRLIFATIRHHSIEDNGLWPLLEASSKEAGEPMDLDSFTEDHVELDALLERTGEAAARFAADPGSGAGELASVVTKLRDLLERHLTREEEIVFPGITRYVSNQDYQRFELDARKQFSPRDLTFLGPWLARYATAEERDRVLAPNLFYKIVLSLGGRGYRALERRVFQG